MSASAFSNPFITAASGYFLPTTGALWQTASIPQARQPELVSQGLASTNVDGDALTGAGGTTLFVATGGIGYSVSGWATSTNRHAAARLGYGIK